MSQWVITPDKYLSVDEVKQLRKTCYELALIAKSKGNQTPVRDATIIELALGTGLRVSELANLMIERLFLKKGQNSLLVKNGKGGKDRVVVFNARLKNQIQEYLDYRTSNSPYLFPSERGDQMTTSAIQKVFKKLAKKAGLPNRYSIHSLRHTHATELYKASGYNLRLTQQQLGHSSPTITSVYAAVLNKDLENAVENLEFEE
ncbi:MAG: phage integrase family protein [Candidatus Marinimicrobia bacterium]|nr:phage integrase family protein [Candidatus Neomarinimicrobiota bacterium]